MIKYYTLKTNSRFRISFLLLLSVVWLLFSLFDSKHIYFGVATVLIVYFWCKNLFFIKKEHDKTYLLELDWLSLIRYMFWLVWQIFLANLSVAKIILFQKEDLDPKFITFSSNLKHPLAKSMLANSITLTPGTITLNVFGDNFEVHTLNDRLAYLVTVGELNRRIGKVFGEFNE